MGKESEKIGGIFKNIFFFSIGMFLINTILLLWAIFSIAPPASAAVLETFGATSSIDTTNCNTSCATFNGSKTHEETNLSTQEHVISSSDTMYATFYAGMDGATYGSFLNAPPSSVSVTLAFDFDGSSGDFCAFQGNFTTEQVAALAGTSLADPILFENVQLDFDSESGAGCRTFPVGTNVYFSYGGGNWNGEMSSYIDGTTASTRIFNIISNTPYVEDPTTRIYGTSPSPLVAGTVPSSVTVATTTVEFSAEYFINSSVALPFGGGVPDEIWLILTRLDQSTSTPAIIFEGAALDTLTATSTEIVLPENSSWNYYWSLVVSDSVGTLSTPSGRLNILSNPIQDQDDFGSNVFLNLAQNIKYKPPIGYVFRTIDAVSGVATTTSAFTIEQEENIMEYIVDPVRNAVAGILWALFGFAYFKRLTHLDI